MMCLTYRTWAGSVPKVISDTWKHLSSLFFDTLRSLRWLIKRRCSEIFRRERNTKETGRFKPFIDTFVVLPSSVVLQDETDVFLVHGSSSLFLTVKAKEKQGKKWRRTLHHSLFRLQIERKREKMSCFFRFDWKSLQHSIESDLCIVKCRLL